MLFSRKRTVPRGLNRVRKKAFAGCIVPSAAKALAQNEVFIAAVNRCATQKRDPNARPKARPKCETKSETQMRDPKGRPESEIQKREPNARPESKSQMQDLKARAKKRDQDRVFQHSVKPHFCRALTARLKPRPTQNGFMKHAVDRSTANLR